MIAKIRGPFVSATIVYLAISCLLFACQRSLLYYPSDFEPSVEYLAERNLKFWPSTDDYRGLTSAGEAADNRATIVVFHGNAGTSFNRRFYLDALSRHGFRVILAEYPGYGGRAGNPSETLLVGDAMESLRIAYRLYGEPLYLWGESLGAGVVSGVAAQTEVPIQGLVMFLPWDSLPGLAQTHYWYLPARWLVLDQYDNVQNLRGFGGKVAVVLAENDEVIPPSHGRNLYESIAADKQLWIIEGAGHNSVPVSPGLAWWKEVSEFILR
jgi:alpha-beta hydrolase superfamily lysophospholipase